MLEKIRDFIKKATQESNQILGIIGIATGFIAALKLLKDGYSKDKTIFWIALLIIAITILVSIFLFVYKRKRPNVRLIVDNDSKSVKPKFIRGLLPFEKGQELFGRDAESSDLITKVESSKFKFGYVSGEAGSGKTSFLKAKFWSDIEARGKYKLVYFDSYNDFLDDLKNKLEAKNILQTEIKVTSQNILIVIDQFEEFFIKNFSMNSRKLFANQLAQLLEINNVYIIISLRKDFVEDLRDFFPSIPNPKNDNSSIYIHNWDIYTAKELLKNFIKRDNLSFSDDLSNKIVSDLAHEKLILPVEFQIVTDYLVKNKINQYSEYKSIGSAQGILINVIKDQINKAADDLENLSIKFILSSLCDKGFDSKRTDGGLTREQVINEFKIFLKQSPITINAIEKKNVENYIKGAILNLKADGFIQETDSKKVNLTHDYLVKAIKIATADLQTREEKANSLLKYYLEQKTNIPNLTIPRKNYLFVKRYASSNLLAEPRPRELLKETKKSRRFSSLIWFCLFPFLGICFVGFISYNDSSYQQNELLTIFINKYFDSGYVIFKKKYNDDSCFLGNVRDTLKKSILLPLKVSLYDEFSYNNKNKIFTFSEYSTKKMYCYRLTSDSLSLIESFYDTDSVKLKKYVIQSQRADREFQSYYQESSDIGEHASLQTYFTENSTENLQGEMNKRDSNNSFIFYTKKTGSENIYSVSISKKYFSDQASKELLTAWANSRKKIVFVAVGYLGREMRNSSLYIFNFRGELILELPEYIIPEWLGGRLDFKDISDSSLIFRNFDKLIFARFTSNSISFVDSVETLGRYVPLNNGNSLIAYFDTTFTVKIVDLLTFREVNKSVYINAGDINSRIYWANSQDIFISDYHSLLYGSIFDKSQEIARGNTLVGSIWHIVTTRDTNSLLVVYDNGKIYSVSRSKKIFGINFSYFSWPYVDKLINSRLGE